MLYTNYASPLSIAINKDTRILLEPVGNSNNIVEEQVAEEEAEALHSMRGERLYC